MQRGNLNDLLCFLALGRERSFTRAAAKLGVSQSALGHTIRDLEERLGIRLLACTTRSVAPTEAGERLLRNVGPRLDEIDAELAAVSKLREKPAGTIRITAGEHAADKILWPALARLLPSCPLPLNAQLAGRSGGKFSYSRQNSLRNRTGIFSTHNREHLVERFFQQAQTLQSRRRALRQKPRKLSRIHHTRLSRNLDAS
jgi:DNA-binding MarR family transcriptional regulator